MKNKRFLSLLLAFCMVFSAVSVLMEVSFASKPDYKMGDVNDSGTIDPEDARLALRISVKLEKYTQTDREYICADIDGNGKVESGDARMILRASVKLEDPTVWTVPGYAGGEEPSSEQEPVTDPPEEEEPGGRKMSQPTFDKSEKVEKDSRHDQYTVTFETIPRNLEELKQIDISDPETAGSLTTCLAILIYDCYKPVEKEMFSTPSPNKSLEDIYEMLKYLCEYEPDSVASTTYHNKLEANDTKTTVHDQLYYNNQYKYIVNSYKNGATVENGYTPTLPVSVTVTEYRDTSGETTPGYPTKTRYKFKSAGADEERFIDLFYSEQDGRWYVYGETWKYLLMKVKDPIVQWTREIDPSVPAGRKMEQPTYVKSEKVLNDFTYVDANTGKKKTENVRLKQYTFTFKTLPETLGELMQFDLSDTETGGYLLTCLAILVHDIYSPVNGEMTTEPSNNAKLEELYKMLQYLCDYNPDSTASTNYHNKLFAKATKQMIHDRLSYNNKYKYTINSYKNGATVFNGYTPDLPVSITVTEYVYDLGKPSAGYPQRHRFMFRSAGADGDRFLDAFYDAANESWFVYGESWNYLLTAVRDPVTQWIRKTDPSVPAGRKMEQPTYVKSEKVLNDFTYVDSNTGQKVTENVRLNQYTFTFKTLPKTLGELMQFDLSDPETGGYLLTCLAILVHDSYEPVNGEMTTEPSNNAQLEELYKMLQYLCDYDPDSSASTNYHNKLFPKATKQMIHDRLSYNNKYKYTINSYKNGATVFNGYTPELPVSITVTEYVYDLGEPSVGYPKRHRFIFRSAGADGDRFLDAFYDEANKSWFVYGESWNYLLTAVRDPVTQWIRKLDSSVPAGRKMEQPTYVKSEKVLNDFTYVDGNTGQKVTENVRLNQYTFTFKTLPETLGELMQFDLSDPETGGYLLTCLAILVHDVYTPVDGEMTTEPSKNAKLEELYKMLQYLCDYDPDSSASTNYHNKLFPKATKQMIHDRLSYNNKYKYTINSYKNGATVFNGYTPELPVSITVTEYVYDLGEPSVGYPTRHRFIFRSAGADGDRFLDAFYDEANKSWFVYGETWNYLLTAIRDPVTQWIRKLDSSVPAGRKMEQPTYVKSEKVLNDFTYVDGNTGQKVTEDVRLNQYAFTFKTLPKTLGELMQFDLSDPETGGYLLTCLAILVHDVYTPVDGEMTTEPSNNAQLEELYKMLQYLCDYDPDSSASTNYHNKLFPKATKQMIHDRLSYNNKYQFTINSYKNGATVFNGYTPDLPVSITVTEYVYDLGEPSVGYPKRHRFMFHSAGADGDRFLDAFYDEANKSWFVYGETWNYLLTAIRDPVTQWIRKLDSSVPAGRKMEQPTYVKSEKVLNDFTYIDGNTGQKVTEDVRLNQYTFTFKTLPETLGELMQFDLSDPETGGYLLTCLAILVHDVYTPVDGEMTTEPSNNAKLEELYKMLQYLCDYDPDSSASTNYHNKLFPKATKQMIHDRLAYNDRYKFTINSYKNGATPENGYKPDSPVSITVSEYVYDLGEPSVGYPKRHRFLFNSSGADGERFLDAFYDKANKSWFVYGESWNYLLTAVRDPSPTKF